MLFINQKTSCPAREAGVWASHGDPRRTHYVRPGDDTLLAETSCPARAVGEPSCPARAVGEPSCPARAAGVWASARKLGAICYIILGFCWYQNASAIESKPVTTPWIRLGNGLERMRVDPKGHFLAFVPAATSSQTRATGLQLLDLKTQNIYQITKEPVGLSFFWSPDGYRLFYREQYKARKKSPASGENGVKSLLKAYDCALHRNIVLDELPFATGILTFDPRDLRMHLMSAAGLHTKRIYFPDERLAKWQVAQRTEDGKWVVAQNGILWLTQGGATMRRLEDDHTPIEAFDISPDGTTIAWATAGGRVYSSKNGEEPKFLGYGRDPKWHPNKPELLFSGARMVGNRAVSYDIKLADLKGYSRFLTSTQFSNERWPQWNANGDQIIYTIDRTTDVYRLEFAQ